MELAPNPHYSGST